MRWLISTDGSDRSHRAARLVAGLLNAQNDEVLLLGVIGEVERPVLDQSLHKLEEILGDVPSRRLVVSGQPAEVIESVASNDSFDVIVYGSRGRRGFVRLLFGSVANELAHEAPCSVLVVRRSTPPLDKILVASTLSEEHVRPIDLAAKIAQRSGAELTVLHVMSQIPLTESDYDTELELTAEQAIANGTREGRLFEAAIARLAEIGVRSRPVLRHGRVLDEILAEVELGNYGLVVLGAHGEAGWAPWENLLVEDMTSDILFNSDCPLLIVR